MQTTDTVVPVPGDRRVPRRRGIAFSTRMMALQLGVVVLVVVLTAGIYGWLSYQRLVAEIGSKALAVAQSVAVEDAVQDSLAAAATAGTTPANAALRDGAVQRLAEALRDRTDSLFVVITDRRGKRWSHPDPTRLGETVSTSPEEALAGREVTTLETGTLGPSVRAKVPVWAPDGRTVVGEVSVGFSTDDVAEALAGALPPILAVAALAVVTGGTGTALLSRRLRSDTLGLEPAEVGELVQDQAVVLYGVSEGVIGVGEDGRVTICNDRARRLLGLTDPAGRTLADLGLPPRVLALLDAADDAARPGVQVVAGGSVLIVTAKRVTRGGRKLGWVVVVRDRTDVEALSRQLDAVGALSTALRAQRHEFANRLHAISGFLRIGRHAEATEYLDEALRSGPLKYPVDFAGTLEDPFLQAFLGAKAMRSAEMGVPLRLGGATLIEGRVSDPQDVTTVLGNLVDNAVTAAVRGMAGERWAEVELLSDAATLYVTVSDSGDGLAGADAEELFAEGYSTAAGARDQAGRGEGFGLSLSRQIARSLGGDLWVLSPGDAGGPGAVFCARLPGVLDAGADASAGAGTGSGTEEGA
ncbi:two-component system CitB family sensor kinase [Sinomonas atrocyanea]|uniref:sensor histidine kinase n=1 Tax=Sinomonas atrocyanea TaxID=37927 RepID=UPI00277E24DE|nr:sensor histidine kinase [Sinomonas atrocyanea]MDP9885015.1 two-component system CitB family sensor kinase [Sinomonas atrocyanea]